jgi:hypothetical protein
MATGPSRFVEVSHISLPGFVASLIDLFGEGYFNFGGEKFAKIRLKTIPLDFIRFERDMFSSC